MKNSQKNETGLFLSIKYKVENEIFEKINECCFVDSGRYQEFLPHEKLQNSPVNLETKREVLSFNLKKDSKLLDLISSWIISTSNKTKKRDQYEFLVKIVQDFFGDVVDEELLMKKMNERIRDFKIVRKSNVLFLSDFQNCGVCRHRSLLLKVLCDILDLRCSLSRGNFKKMVSKDSFEYVPHVWNRVVVEGNSFLVDLMQKNQKFIPYEKSKENYIKLSAGFNETICGYLGEKEKGKKVEEGGKRSEGIPKNLVHSGGFTNSKLNDSLKLKKKSGEKIEVEEKKFHQWECEQCKTRNFKLKIGSLQCNKCGKKKQGTWDCVQCQSSSPLTEKKCCFCLLPKIFSALCKEEKVEKKKEETFEELIGESSLTDFNILKEKNNKKKKAAVVQKEKKKESVMLFTSEFIKINLKDDNRIVVTQLKKKLKFEIYDQSNCVFKGVLKIDNNVKMVSDLMKNIEGNSKFTFISM